MGKYKLAPEMIKGGTSQVMESLAMKREEDPLKAMIGLFEGKMDKSSTDLVREIREESEARFDRLKIDVQSKPDRQG